MSISGQVSFGGLGSGTDFNAMVEQLKKIEAIPMQRMEMWKADWQARIDGFNVITDLMTELQMKTGDLDRLTDYISASGSTSNESAVSVKTDNDAVEGTYTLDVKQLAKPSIFSTKAGFAKNEDGEFASLGTGSMNFTYTLGSGEAVSIDLKEGSSIEDLVERINNDAQNPGVKASLIPSGSSYVFQLQSTKTGADQQITIDSDIPTLSTDAGVGANWNSMNAQDAKFVLNGFDEQVLSSSSNSVSGVIDGVTFDLKAQTPAGEPLTIAVKKDTSGMEEKVREWVGTVNNVISTVRELTAVDSSATAKDPNDTTSQWDSEIGSVLTGNYAVQLFSSRLTSLITSPTEGLTSQLGKNGEPNTYSLLSELGITTDVTEGSPTQGQLVIDTLKLTEAIDKNPDSVAQIFGGSGGTSNSKAFMFASATDNVVAGNYEVEYEFASGVTEGKFGELTSVKIDGVDVGLPDENGRVTVSDKDHPAYGLSIQFTSGKFQAQDPNNAESVGIIEGKGKALDKFFKAETRDVVGADDNGGIPLVRSNYKDIINNIDKKIEKEISRLALWETRQKARYARLDAHLGVQQQVMTANASALAAANIGGQ